MNKFIKWGLIIVCVIALFFSAWRILTIVYPTKYNQAVSSGSIENGLPESLIYAVIKAESNFDPNAQSTKNAIGLMQIMEPTAQWVCEKTGTKFPGSDMLKEPEQNIQIGCYYLSYLLKLYDGNQKCALAAYNAGYANVNAWLSDSAYSKNGTDLDVIPFPETEQYVNRVLTNQRIYQFLY